MNILLEQVCLCDKEDFKQRQKTNEPSNSWIIQENNLILTLKNTQKFKF